MTDQTIPAAAIRAWRDKYRGCTGNNALEALDALLPPPPRPTLADMTPKERVACRLMQADVEEGESRAVIINPHWEYESARVLWPGGIIGHVGWEYVTPRPDLPRMEWPSTEKAAPAPALPDGWRLADHADYGRVIVTNTTPDGDGEVCFVALSVGFLGHGCHFCTPAELTYLDQGADTADTVPENTLAVGSTWEYAREFGSACREAGLDKVVVADNDGDVDVWDVRRDRWGCVGSTPRFAPYTIIHTGRKADQ